MFSFHSLTISLIYIRCHISLSVFLYLPVIGTEWEGNSLWANSCETWPSSTSGRHSPSFIPSQHTWFSLSSLSLPSCTPEPVVHTWPKECKCVAGRCPTPQGAAKGADQYNKKRACVPGLCDGAWRKCRVCLLVHLRAAMFMWAVRVQGSSQRKCCASLYSSGAKERVWFFSFGGFFFF